MAKWIHNISNVAKEFQGRTILPTEFFSIPATLLSEFQSDEALLLDLLNNSVRMSTNGSTDIESGSEGIDFLKNIDASPRDSDGSPIVRSKTTRTGWHYEPRSLDFTTSKVGSLYNRKHNGFTFEAGSDYGDASMIFFDALGNVLTEETSIETSTVLTQLDWQYSHDMDALGFDFTVYNPPTPPSRAYLWVVVAPDIPEQYGGSVPFCSGGFNLCLLNKQNTLFFDGRGIKTFLYDPINKSNKIRAVIKHEPGAKMLMQINVWKFNA